MGNYEDLDAFKNALDLMVVVYDETKTFPPSELYGLTAQMRRASGSVVSHIGEAHGRITFGERRQLLSQGRGSLFEVEAQTLAAGRLGFLSEEAVARVRKSIRHVARPLNGLIGYTQRRERESKRPSSTVNSQPST